MKAIIMNEYMKLEYVDIPMPEIKEDEVLVRVKAASVCGSDIHGINGKTKRRQPPIVMGHEASGVIEKVGGKVKNYNAGDRVTFDSTVYCGECYYCRTGEINLCDSRMVLGASCDDYRRYGAFAEYVALPERILYPLDDAISFEEAALVEPMSVALHAISLLPQQHGSSVVLFGTGTIALFAIQLFKLRGFVKLIVVGRNNKNLELARTLGADHIINSRSEDVVSAVRKLTDGDGADFAFDAAGAQSTFDDAMHSIKKGGHFVTIANLAERFTIDMIYLITRQLTIHGSCAANGENAEILNWLKEKKIRTDYVVSAVVPMSEAPELILKIYHKEIADFHKLILQP